MRERNNKVVDFLDARGIEYRRLHFSGPAPTVEALVREQGVVLEEMVKSILLREQPFPRRYVMACVVGDARLDPRAVRASLPQSAGWKRLTFASAEEIRAVTGFAPGVVAPVCLPAGIPVVFDEAIVRCERVNIASGDEMLGLELSREDLVRLARPRFAVITKPEP
jgi:Cys-tRNA(Pro)/Cys-tRNA(Cys) deacylase